MSDNGEIRKLNELTADPAVAGKSGDKSEHLKQPGYKNLF